MKLQQSNTSRNKILLCKKLNHEVRPTTLLSITTSNNIELFLCHKGWMLSEVIHGKIENIHNLQSNRNIHKFQNKYQKTIKQAQQRQKQN